MYSLRTTTPLLFSGSRLCDKTPTQGSTLPKPGVLTISQAQFQNYRLVL